MKLTGAFVNDRISCTYGYSMTQTKDFSLEQDIAETNADFFLAEFSFSQTQIKIPNHTQVELADNVIFIDDILVVFQLKARSEQSPDPDKEISWYQNKVLNKATKQIRDTISYLETSRINLKNDRGHSVDLPKGLSNYRVLKVIVYSPGQALPEIVMRQKGHVSSSLGFIHLLRLGDYKGLLRSLVTLPEIIDYFEYRERLCHAFPAETRILPEQALVGHYIRGDESIIPAENDATILSTLGNPDSFDILGILQKFKDRTYATKTKESSSSQTEYYKIIKELLYLDRSSLEMFKMRFTWAWDNCGGDPKLPTRFIDPDRGCGFVFVPIPKGEEGHAEVILNNLTVLAKYESRFERYLGIAFRRDGEYRLIDWMYCESQWKEDPEAEAMLKTVTFRPLKQANIPRY